MKTRNPLRKAVWLVIPLALGACGTKPRPPVFNLYVHTRVAVLQFRNSTADAALGSDLRDAVIAELKRLDAVPVVDAPAEAAASAAPWTDPQWRARLRESANCDLILAGSVSAYTDSVVSEEPKRVKSRLSYGSRWGWADQAQAHLEAVVMLVDASTGAVVWTRKTPGDGKQGRWTELDWPGDTSSAPPEGWADLKARASVAQETVGPSAAETALARAARAEALAEVVRTVSTDFLGRDGWQPPARPESAPGTGALPSR